MATRGATLVPYVPRVSLEWLVTEPSTRHRRLDGTMAFVDVSGFTAMSERLAPKGKLGAEEVTDVMSATFTRLLAVAYEFGGGLVKFGGDALLLFFEGERHAEAACSAAFGMRSTLADIGALQTSAGPVELQMHVGIHSGVFDFFLVGRSHRELIVAGPAAVRTVEMEEAAAAGEIALSNDAAARLDLDCLGERRAEAVLLAAPPRFAAPGIRPLPDLDGVDVSPCIPLALRALLEADKVEAEHRHAAVAFLRFSGVGPLLEAGTGADAVEEVVTCVSEAAAAHGVCFLESDIDAEGGRLVLVAGVPTTSGDDEERLLRTVRAAVDARTRLPLHVGVAAGNVFSGSIGPPYRRTFTILGGTAALAARLMAKAPERAIWTTPDVVQRSRTEFDVTPLEALALKGKRERTAAVAVGALGSTRAPTTQKLSLVDRQRELPVLEAALVPVRLGFGNFVELVGPAGIGKSRVVEEVCDRAGDVPVVATGCEQYEATTPYFAFRRLLEAVLDVPLHGTPEVNSRNLVDRLEPLAPALVPWLPLVADVLDVSVPPTPEVDDLQPSFRRARLNGAVEELLTALFPTPTLLLFEDTHWMDEASADLLRHLGSRVATKPWLVCATRRGGAGGFAAADGNPPVPALTLQLDPIPEDDARELAAAAADITQDELDAIVERAGGNPLFVRELAAATAEAKTADTEELPDTVEEVLAARIDSLAPGDRALLRWASVLGSSFSGDLVPEVLAADPDAALDSESWDRLAEFVERDPYVPGVFRFRHALIRDAAYNGLSFRRRRELHGRVADVMQRGAMDEAEIAEALSLHFHFAERREETWRYSMLAAERAKAKYANVEAAEFYRRALDAARLTPTLSRAEVGLTWQSLGDVLVLNGDYSEARIAYRRSRQHLRGDEDALATLALREGKLREHEGRYDLALRWYMRGLQRLDELGEARRSHHRLQLSLGYAAARYREGAFDECVEWVERVVADARTAGALEELAHAYYLLHLAYTSLGRPERIEIRDLSLPIYEELGDLLGQGNTLNNLGIDAYYEGRWDDALDLYARSRDARQRIGDVVGTAMASNNIAEILSDQGHYDQAEELFRDVHAICDAAGHRLLAAVADANLGRLAARRGNFLAAGELLARALGTLTSIGALSFVVETKIRLAEAALLAGEPESALQIADGALANEGSAGAPNVLALAERVRGYALAALDRRDEALAALEKSLQTARAADTLYELALTLRARAALTASEDDVAEAARIFRALHVVHVAERQL
ncbi:MAG TPA: tetratricopeptide repeat protein [Gaiellaceae bacterium]|nr:tetratricopeptide repeat protein [Gaiellaceae bacterium]